MASTKIRVECAACGKEWRGWVQADAMDGIGHPKASLFEGGLKGWRYERSSTGYGGRFLCGCDDRIDKDTFRDAVNTVAAAIVDAVAVDKPYVFKGVGVGDLGDIDKAWMDVLSREEEEDIEYDKAVNGAQPATTEVEKKTAFDRMVGVAKRLAAQKPKKSAAPKKSAKKVTKKKK